MAAVPNIELTGCPGLRVQKESPGLLWQVIEGEAFLGKGNVVLPVPWLTQRGTERHTEADQLLKILESIDVDVGT